MDRTFTLPIVRLPPLASEALPQFWHPQRFGVHFAPDAFRHALQSLQRDLDCTHSDGLDCTWMPVDERWLIWQQDPTVTHALCAGWSLKIVWEGPGHTYLPLDARVFADICARQIRRYEGTGRGYFDRVCGEIERTRARQKKDTDADSTALRREVIQSRRISNIGRGNKFALHHDGTIVPSRGELNWRRELARTQGGPL